jgi:hypothetical protein
LENIFRRNVEKILIATMGFVLQAGPGPAESSPKEQINESTVI